MVSEKQMKVYSGIDMHADTHHVAVIDATGQRVADVQVHATAAGYQAALRFLGTCPALVSVGIECTGSYGAAVTRVVREAGIEVFEVNRPNRFDRRLRAASAATPVGSFKGSWSCSRLDARHTHPSRATGPLVFNDTNSIPHEPRRALQASRKPAVRNWLISPSNPCGDGGTSTEAPPSNIVKDCLTAES